MSGQKIVDVYEPLRELQTNVEIGEQLARIESWNKPKFEYFAPPAVLVKAETVESERDNNVVTLVEVDCLYPEDQTSRQSEKDDSIVGVETKTMNLDVSGQGHGGEATSGRFPEILIPEIVEADNSLTNQFVGSFRTGELIEGIGKISEIMAQCGKILPDSEQKLGCTAGSLEFSVWGLTYGTLTIDTNDLTNLFLPGDPVAFTARVERDFMNGSFPVGSRYWFRILDVARLVDEKSSVEMEADRTFWLEEAFGTVISVKEDGGLIKSDRWGVLPFVREALELKEESCSKFPVYKMVRKGRVVRFRCFSSGPAHKEWTVISVTPNGDIRRGEGTVILAGETYAFVHSKDFGDIYVPFHALTVPREMMKLPLNTVRMSLFKTLKCGVEVHFEIVKNLPHCRCPWRALSVITKA